MEVIIGAILFGIIVVINVLIICGLPLGEFTMGGRYKVLPKKLRIMAVFSLFLQIFAIIIILQTGNRIPLFFSMKTTKYICLAYAIYLTFNCVMNFFSKSKKEKYVMGPLSIIATICFWIAAL